MRTYLGLLTPLGVLLSLTSCNDPSTPAFTPLSPPTRISEDLPEEQPLSEWEKKRWIDRAARKLRYGASLSPGELTPELITQSQSQIVDRFMMDDRFGDALLDFNMYFLGVKTDSMRTGSGYSYLVWDTPNALGSAMSLYARPGTPEADYLRLLDLHHPFYVRPLAKPRIEHADDAGLSDQAARANMLNRLVSRIDKLIAYVDANPGATGAQIHDLYFADYVNDWYYFGFDVAFMAWAIGTRGWEGGLWLAKHGGYQPAQGWRNELTRLRAQRIKLKDYVLRLQESAYNVKTLRDIKSWDFMTELGSLEGWTMFNPINSQQLTNSSTNFNRKRAAYVLKRFFCDDLVPINVGAPADHARGRHASDPSCQSCHYRLDPLAGAFRNVGFNMINYTDASVLMFDDQVRVDKAQYETAWRAEPRSGRTWDIGIIRSTEFTDRNDYFDDMNGLFAIIRKAPEVRRCLMRRLVEYTVGENQAIDPGYLDHLTLRFNQETEREGSVIAIKRAFKRVLMSRAFSERDRQSDTCYDLPPGTSPSSRPPCRVAHLVEKNCASCHSSQSARGGLDLTHWIRHDDGGMGFVHRDERGALMPRLQTLQSLISRLDTQDDGLRMPLSRYMPPHERTELYLWAHEQARSGGRHRSQQ